MSKWLQTLVIPALFLMLACVPARAAGNNFKTAIENYLTAEPIENLRIQPDALQDDPREDFYFVVDVRTPHEFEAGHIRGAVNLPYYQVPAHLDRLPADRGEPILLYCEAAQRSTQALMALRLLGYSNVWYLNGGITRWQREGRPIVTSPAKSESK
jgi:rhodanese-related sulfurtransferase